MTLQVKVCQVNWKCIHKKSLVVMHFGNAGDWLLLAQYSSTQFDWPSDYFSPPFHPKYERRWSLHAFLYLHCVQIRKTWIKALDLCSRRKKYSQLIWDWIGNNRSCGPEVEDRNRSNRGRQYAHEEQEQELVGIGVGLCSFLVWSLGILLL